MDIFFEKTLSDFYNDFPLVLIDVGASGGLEKNWLEAKRHLQIIGFEPDERAYNELIEKSYFNPDEQHPQFFHYCPH